MSKYYIVSNEILPDVLDQVVEARELLQSGAVRKISQAVKAVGISRGTYYKYKDHIFTPTKEDAGVIVMTPVESRNKRNRLDDT